MNIKTTPAGLRAVSAYQSSSVAKTQEPQDKSPASSMKVAISAGSQALSGAGADVNMEKVQSIRAALADGTLKINPERIAQGLIDSAEELMGKK